MTCGLGVGLCISWFRFVLLWDCLCDPEPCVTGRHHSFLGVGTCVFWGVPGPGVKGVGPAPSDHWLVS